MTRFHRSLVLAAFLLAFGGFAAAQPVIVDFNRTDAPRSGRIAIEGLGFGTDGQVFVAGLVAWTTTWTDGRVVAYVPEAAPLGTATVHVVVDSVQSNEMPLTVTTRQSEGRIRWSFEADADNLWWRPALAPDGTVYIHTNNDTDGLVYALSADGALKWVQKVNWYPYVPPTAGPDGAVYVGSGGTIYRISAEGNIDWQYSPPDGVNIEVSPTIGPDGLLYGAFEISGAFAIEPLTGELVWSNPGDPIMSDKSGEAVEAKFGPSGPGEPVDQFYISMDGGGSFYAFSLNGDQLFTSGFGNIKGTAEVAIGSDGTIYGPRAIGLVVAAVDPSDGSTLWEYYPGASEWATGTNNVEIGPDDMLYFVGSSAKLEAFDPGTQQRQWQEFTVLDVLKRPSVTPDGSTLIVSGSDEDIFGGPGFVKAFNSNNGHELWRLDLPFELVDGSFRVYGTHHAKITPDSSRAYLSTFSLAQWPYDGDPHTFLYAIDLTGNGSDPPASCNDNGVCDVGEDCESCPADCPGNTTGNPADRWCCGDGQCSGPEDGFVCALDCGAPASCGDGTCDAGEGVCDCPSDCGPSPTGEVPGATCADGVDNDCDGSADCDDADCGIGESVFVSEMTMSADEDRYPILTFQDPNPPSAVTGYNIYRCDDPALSPDAWPQIASNATDMDEVDPDHQWIDTSGDVAPGAIWYYKVAAYNSVCSAEGPW